MKLNDDQKKEFAKAYFDQQLQSCLRNSGLRKKGY